jgi:hypothetical protein
MVSEIHSHFLMYSTLLVLFYLQLYDELESVESVRDNVIYSLNLIIKDLFFVCLYSDSTPRVLAKCEAKNRASFTGKAFLGNRVKLGYSCLIFIECTLCKIPV